MEQLPDSEGVALWRATINLERTWRAFAPTPFINKSLFGVLMCVAHLPRVETALQTDSPPSCKDAPPDLSSDVPPVAVSAIAAQLHQSLPAVSQKISALEEQGLVRRTTDPRDRRVTCVALTEEGCKQLQEGKRAFEKKLNQALAVLGRDKLRQLTSLLAELETALRTTSQTTKTLDEGDTTTCSN